jgi:hypothetical protein
VVNTKNLEKKANKSKAVLGNCRDINKRRLMRKEYRAQVSLESNLLQDFSEPLMCGWALGLLSPKKSVF